MELLIESAVECPYCWETYISVIDTSESSFETVEDCPVCCRPIRLSVECDPGEVHSIRAEPDA